LSFSAEGKIKTGLLMKSLSDAFRGVPGITLLVASGALVREHRGAIDLLVVTRRPKDARIERAVRQVETKVSLPIRYAVFDTREYEERRVARDRLLRDIFEFEHAVILGRS
jgi:hemin uptake protein HemP